MRWAVLSGAVVLAAFTAACGESQRGGDGANGSAARAGAASNGGGAGGREASGAGGGEASGAGGGAGRGGSSGGSTGGSAMAGSAGMTAAGASGVSGSMSSGAGGGVNAGGASEVGGAGAIAGAGAIGGAGAVAGTSAVEDPPEVTVRLDRPQQVIDGFGIGDNLLHELDSDEAFQLFEPTSGLGLTILRFFVTSSGIPVSSTAWDDVANARRWGATKFIATVRSAPASCKSNFDEDDGGHLNADCYEQWADNVAEFPVLFREKNPDIYLAGMSFQNEPDYASCGDEPPCNGSYPSMLYTATEFVNFVKVLAPKLRNFDPGLLLMGPETNEWSHLWSNESAPDSNDPLGGTGYDYGHALHSDPTAWSMVDVLATHQYGTQRAVPWPSDVPATKPVWMTEMAGFFNAPEAGPSSDIANGVAVAGWIHDALVNGMASAWLWYTRQAEFYDDNEGLYLKDGTVTKRYWALGNFSRFVRPGDQRVSVTGVVPAGVLLSAYRVRLGDIVVVAINQGSAPVSVPIFIAGGDSPEAMVSHETSETANLDADAVTPVQGGAFTATLPAMSVTTFVGGKL